MVREEILEQFSKLLDVMNDLREKCPWDMKQTWESIRVLSIEEVHELSDAIMDNNPTEVRKELGDILLHIVFNFSFAALSLLFNNILHVPPTNLQLFVRGHSFTGVFLHNFFRLSVYSLLVNLEKYA